MKKQSLSLIGLSLLLSFSVQAKNPFVLDHEAFSSILDCLGQESDAKIKVCLFQERTFPIELSSSCYRIQWNNTVIPERAKNAKEQLGNDIVKTSAKVAMRFCRAAAVAFEMHNFFVNPKDIVDYPYCDSQNKETQEIAKMMESTYQDLYLESKDMEMAEGVYSGWAQVNNLAAETEQDLCKEIASGVIDLSPFARK